MVVLKAVIGGVSQFPYTLKRGLCFICTVLVPKSGAHVLFVVATRLVECVEERRKRVHRSHNQFGVTLVDALHYRAIDSAVLLMQVFVRVA